MKTHETSTEDTISSGLFGEIMGPLAAAVQACVPSELQYWVGKKGELVERTVAMLKEGSKFLELIADNIAIATEPFTKRSFWTTTDGPVKLYPDSGDFGRLLFDVMPAVIPGFHGTLKKIRVTKQTWDLSIRRELGNPTPFTIDEVSAILSAMLLKQAHGERGDLETTRINNFHMRLEDERVGLVYVIWCVNDRGWLCCAQAPVREYGGKDREFLWDEGAYIFFRGSDALTEAS